MIEQAKMSEAADFVIRPALADDIPAVARLDSRITGLAKPCYWAEMFERYGSRQNRFFLIADGGDKQVYGFIIGEVRAWEFGSPPCGWVFAIGVDPDIRLKGIGSRLFEELCACLAACGVDKLRTMLACNDELNMAFFRSQGMMRGPFIQLEMPLDDPADNSA